jgi:hypothetical protein
MAAGKTALKKDFAHQLLRVGYRDSCGITS